VCSDSSFREKTKGLTSIGAFLDSKNLDLQAVLPGLKQNVLHVRADPCAGCGSI
jgi:hypothetical protein